MKYARSADGEARRLAGIKAAYAKLRRLPTDNGDGTCTPEAAYAARRALAERLHGEFARHA